MVFDKPLHHISELQLIDYDFPDTYVGFKTQQSIDSPIKINGIDGLTTLLTIPAGKYTLRELRYLISQSDKGIELYSSLDLISRNATGIVSGELSKKLGIPSRISKGKYYPILWPSYKYHVYIDINTSRSELGPRRKDTSNQRTSSQ